MKSKILMLAHSFVVPRYRAGVANDLAKNPNYDVRLFSPQSSPMAMGKVYNYEPASGEPFTVTTGKTIFQKKSSFMLYTTNLLDTIKTWQPNIIDIFDEAPWGWAVAQTVLLRNLFSPKTKIALFVDNNIDRKWSGLRFFYKFIERYTISNADRVYVPIENSGFERIVRKCGYKGKISYVSGSIDVSLFKPRFKDPKVEAVRKELGLNKSDIVLGIVGGLSKYQGHYPKGTPAAIQACASLPSNYKILLVGAGNQNNLQELREIAKQNNVDPSRILTTDFIPFEKMPLYYNVLDVVLALSVPRNDWAEPCGRMQLEGMASGVPVIATDCGSNKAIVGRAGFVVKVNDYRAISQKIKQLTQNKALYDKLSLAARKRAVEVFSIEAVSKRRDSIYLELLNKN